VFELDYIGHAGWVIKSDNFKAAFDPWLNPQGTFLNSWHQFPDNSHLMSDDLLRDLDFLYISHAHHDHCDIWTLQKICKKTLVIIPKFRDKTLKSTLGSIGFVNIKELREEVKFSIKNVNIEMVIEDGFNDRDSAIILDNGQSKIINLNDCHPSFEKIKKYSKNTDILLLQCSSAIWWPCVYDYSHEELIKKCSQKRKNVLNRALQYAKHIDPKCVIPNAGPPVFLNDQFNFWDKTRKEDYNPFPLHDDIHEFYKSNNISSCFVIPGSKVVITPEKIINHTDIDERNRIYGDLGSYLKDLKNKKTLRNDLSNSLLPSGRDLSNLVPKFKSLIKIIREQSKIFIHKINFPVLIEFSSHSKWIIDFSLDPEECFERFDEQSYIYAFEFDPQIVSMLIDRERIDFDEYFLSMRFKCSRREDIFNEFLFTMFKNLDIKSFLLSENIYLTNSVGDKDDLETFVVDFGHCKKRIQKFCPHKGVDLEKCGILENDHIVCPLHNWCFDLKDGKCKTSDKYKLVVEEITD
jgi:UDP-MurNAc hydroxylase